MGYPRHRPKLLHEKLLAIRTFLDIGQVGMANKIEAEILARSGRRYHIHASRISEFETGRREPPLIMLIAYIHLGSVHMESVVDDDVTIDEFRKLVGKEFDHVTGVV